MFDHAGMDSANTLRCYICHKFFLNQVFSNVFQRNFCDAQREGHSIFVALCRILDVVVIRRFIPSIFNSNVPKSLTYINVHLLFCIIEKDEHWGRRGSWRWRSSLCTKRTRKRSYFIWHQMRECMKDSVQQNQINILKAFPLLLHTRTLWAERLFQNKSHVWVDFLLLDITICTFS